MTYIEESSIRNIISLISIVKLTHGNIDSKGNTTCMCNKSKLSTILPNLLSKSQYLILTYNVKKIVPFH